MSSLSNSASKNITWSVIEGFSVQFIQFVISIIIAHFVLPEEFGLIAMLTIFIATAQTFTDSGFSNALIQKQDRTEKDFSTVFYFNLIIAIFLYLILFFTSSAIANFYNAPILALLAKYIGLNIIISSFSIVQKAKFIIKNDFKTPAKASLIAVFCSGLTGIYLAYSGFGVWALVVQSVSNILLNSTFLWIFAMWRPKLQFSYESFKILFPFGSKILFAGLLNTLYVNMYTLVIGKVYSPTNVGYFSRSNMFAQFPSNYFTNFIVRAIYPIQCELQNDNIKLRDSMLKYIHVSSFIIFPIMVLLCVLAKPVILCLLTDKWLPSAALLQILCIAYIWFPIRGIVETLNAKGRSDLFLKAEIIKKIAAIVICGVSFPFGMIGMCYGLIVYSILDMFIIIYFIKKVIPLGFITTFKAFFPNLVISIVAGGISYITILFISNIYLQLSTGALLGGIAYLSFAYICKIKALKILYSQAVIINKNTN